MNGNAINEAMERPAAACSDSTCAGAGEAASSSSRSASGGHVIRRPIALAACLALVLAFALSLALAGCGSSQVVASDAANGITVKGSSDAKVVPDKARISVSVVSEGKEAEACQSKNAESVNAVVAALKELGIEETGIQTTYSDLNPRYGSRTTDVSKKGAASEASEDGEVSAAGEASEGGEAYDEWVITGYEMTTTLKVSDLDIDNVGAAMQACVAAGANETDGIEYYASNYDEKYNEALAAALATAKAKADGIASATGARLGKVVNVVEGYQDTSARYTTMASNDAELDALAGDAKSVAETMPGQLEISAEVTVTYAIS